MRHAVFGRCFVGSLVAIVVSAGTLLAQEDGTNQPETPLAGAPAFATCCAADAFGNVWIGTEDTGIWCYKPDTKSWTHDTTKEGFGDDAVYALAFDRNGRLWAGHDNHGVSVFNGKSWRNYSNWATPNGPLGDRVFAIAADPANGDVWIATELGISRYSDQQHAWSYLTRADGMPENAVRGIAFDHAGNVYLALATQGVAIAKSAETLPKWRHVKGPDEMPVAASGDGLPGNLTNCVATDAHDVVYVGTTQGIAVSRDHGGSWKFFRGKEWAELAGALHPDAADAPADSGLLNEDWVNRIEPDDAGTVWVAFRKMGYQRIDFKAGTSLFSETEPPPAPPPPEGNSPRRPTNNVTAMLVRGSAETPLICRYESPAAWCTAGDARLEFHPSKPVEIAGDFPAPAPPPTPEFLTAARAKLSSPQPTGSPAAYLGEDWATQGDWVGRYGNTFAAVIGVDGKPDSTFGNKDAYIIDLTAGLHSEVQMPYWWEDGPAAQQRRVLWDPAINQRIQSELNDQSYAEQKWPAKLPGPGIWLRIETPEGPHRLSLYFSNFDGHSSRNAYRDFVLDVRRQPENVSDDVLNDRTKITDLMWTQPLLATGRASHFWNGVYEQFLLRGKGVFWIRINRNHSFVTKLQGIFLDALSPASQGADTLHLPPTTGPAADLLQAIDTNWSAASIELFLPDQKLAYRSIDATNASDEIKAAWRTKLALWNNGDREDFEPRMKKAFEESHNK